MPPLAYFLVDNAAFVLGAAMDPKHAKPAKVKDAVKRLRLADTYFERFRKRWMDEFVPAAEAAGGVPPVANAVTKFLLRHDPIAFRNTDMFGMCRDERFFETWMTFEVEDDDGDVIIVLDDPDVKSILSSARRGKPCPQDTGAMLRVGW